MIPASLSKPEISCGSETRRQLGWNCDFSRHQLTDSLNGHAKEADEENLIKRMCHFRGGDSGRVLIFRHLRWADGQAQHLELQSQPIVDLEVADSTRCSRCQEAALASNVP